MARASKEVIVSKKLELVLNSFKLPCYTLNFLKTFQSRSIEIILWNIRYVHQNLNFHICWQNDCIYSKTPRIQNFLLKKRFLPISLTQCSDMPWPAQSPDLFVHDYFLWEYLNVKMFVNKPCTPNAQDMVWCAMHNFQHRVHE